MLPTGQQLQKPPRAPTGLSKQVQSWWRTFWESDVAGVVHPENMPALRRLFNMYDERERAQAIVKKALVVKGSVGQVRVNPLASHVGDLDGRILKLENELGLTPLARARLGIAVGEAAMTAEEINRMAREHRGDEAGDVDVAEIAAEGWEAAE